MSNPITNIKEDNSTSLEIKEEEGHVPALSTSSLMTISKCVNLITEQETQLITKEIIDNKNIKSNFQIHKGKNPIENPYISETLRSKMSQMIIETCPNQTPLNKYIKRAAEVNSKSQRFKTESSSFYQKNFIGKTSSKISRIDQQRQQQFPITQSCNCPMQEFTYASKLTQKMFIYNNPSLSNVIHLSNEMQNKKKKMLFGLYKHKMEFEDDLNDFKSQLEKKNKTLFSSDLRLKYTNSINGNENQKQNIINKSDYNTKASFNDIIKRNKKEYKMKYHTSKPSIHYQPPFMLSS